MRSVDPASLARPFEKRWKKTDGLPSAKLLRAAVLRDLVRQLHTQKSRSLAEGRKEEVIPIHRIEQSIESIYRAGAGGKKNLKALLDEYPAEEASPEAPLSLPSALTSKISASALERYDRKWEKRIAASAVELGWKFWSLECWVTIRGVEIFNQALADRVWPRIIDFETIGKIAREADAHFVVDMAHIAGLVAAGLHPTPVPHATYTTSTTHKTLRGPRGGLILGTAEKIKAVNSQIFPGIQGGPLMHVIAAKAVCFGEALTPAFKSYQKQVVENAKTLAASLQEKGLSLVTDGTDNHLMLVDLTATGDGQITGKDAETWLDLAGITVNKNTIPNEKRSPFVTSGIRIGVPAITTRGMGTSEMKQIATWIAQALDTHGDLGKLGKIRDQVKELCKRHPLYN